MPTVDGEVKSTRGSDLQAVFYIDDIPRYFMGALNPTVTPFKTSQETLTYASIDDLTATRPFIGRLGDTTITITIQDIVDVNGTLEARVTPSQFAGAGTWTANTKQVSIQLQFPLGPGNTDLYWLQINTSRRRLAH